MHRFLLTRVSEALIALLIFIALLAQVFVLPLVSQSLSEEYSEYSQDKLSIQIMLSAIVAVGQIVLALVWLLLSRIRNRALISETTLKWVNALATSLFAAGATLTVLLGWLISKNTLPPGLAGVLVLAILVTCTVALVTISLRGVLREAINTQIEMQAVI